MPLTEESGNRFHIGVFMTLASCIVKTGSTAMTPTGGSDQTFTPDGQTVANGVHVHDAAQADFRVRDNITFKNKNPTLNGDGTYSKAKRSALLVMPRLLASGLVVFNLARLELEVHPEMVAAVELDLRMKAAQLFGDTDLTLFWSTGTVV
jgi:hypothetical protein